MYRFAAKHFSKVIYLHKQSKKEEFKNMPNNAIKSTQYRVVSTENKLCLLVKSMKKHCCMMGYRSAEQTVHICDPNLERQ